MRNQPTNNNKNNRRKQSSKRQIIISTTSLANWYRNSNIWPIASDHKAHSSAFALRSKADCQLIIWLAEIMLYLHQSTERRARWSGPCGHHSGCRLIW
jgi:hypothetical protein